MSVIEGRFNLKAVEKLFHAIDFPLPLNSTHKQNSPSLRSTKDICLAATLARTMIGEMKAAAWILQFQQTNGKSEEGIFIKFQHALDRNLWVLKSSVRSVWSFYLFNEWKVEISRWK